MMSVDICRTPHKPDYYVFVVTTSVIGYQIPPPINDIILFISLL